MNYSKPKLNNILMSDIPVENIFISEFLPDAPGDFVKIYLYGRLQAEASGVMPEKDMALELGVTEERIMEAWDYWESWGAIRKRYLDEEGTVTFGIEFVNLKEQMFDTADIQIADNYGEEFPPVEEAEPVGGPAMFRDAEEAAPEGSGNLVPLIEEKLGRPLGITEMQKILSWRDDLGISQEVITYCVDYCMARGKTNFNYITATLEGWSEQGLTDVDLVEEYISKFDERFKQYKRVLKALGLYRNPTEEEKRILDSWFDEMGYNMPKILEACAKTASINNPNINYVNAVLKGWYEEAKRDNRDVNSSQAVTNAKLMEYYSYIKEKADREAEERLQELYRTLPQVEAMDRQLGSLGVKLGRALMSKDKAAAKEISDAMEILKQDRAIMLAENNFDIDYTSPRYKCKECGDTGIAEMGGLCQACREARRVEAEIWLRERETQGTK